MSKRRTMIPNESQMSRNRRRKLLGSPYAITTLVVLLCSLPWFIWIERIAVRISTLREINQTEPSGVNHELVGLGMWAVSLPLQAIPVVLVWLAAVFVQSRIIKLERRLAMSGNDAGDGSEGEGL